MTRERPESADLADIVAAPLNDLAETGAPTFDAAHFRAVLGHFCTGITIVTGLEAGEPVGLTCQSFTSLSLDPPLVAFSPGKSSTSWPRIRPSGVFCVNVLTEDQEDICRVFATTGVDKFRGVGWRASETGSPIIGDTLAWVDCRMVAEHDAGDHLIVVGQVVDLDAAHSGRPLL
ncbi:MAG TPA: flavin reductase family protein, partial [Acidimicrobiales bacterium]|nr:flavin reductase family protein [Acidimicrobiales bacterium]